jgi:ABC-2 type transport system ATP-binding protein
MVAPAPYLSVQTVHKRFARVHAVAGVSLDVAPQEIFALLGPNGAGKSTLLRMLVGITRPDEGQVLWGGSRTARIPAPDLGYLPEDRGLYQDIPVLRVLTYFGELRGMPRDTAQAAGLRWLERLDLGPRKGDKVSTLSKGNQQKVQFAAAVLHQPRFAVLDEPFSGLDPLNQELFLTLVRELRDGGTTVLFSAHQMSLVERLADRVFVMQAGREVLAGTVSAIRDRWGEGMRLVLDVDRDPGAAVEALTQHPAVAALTHTSTSVTITLVRGHHVGDLLGTCAQQLSIVRVRTEEPSLHEMYVAAVSPATPTPEAA